MYHQLDFSQVQQIQYAPLSSVYWNSFLLIPDLCATFSINDRVTQWQAREVTFETFLSLTPYPPQQWPSPIISVSQTSWDVYFSPFPQPRFLSPMSVGTFFFISVIIIQFNLIPLPYFFSQHGDLVLKGFQWVSFGNLASLASSVFLPQGPCTYWWLVRAKPFPISALVLWLSCDAFQEMLTGYSVVSYFQVHQAPSFFPLLSAIQMWWLSC